MSWTATALSCARSVPRFWKQRATCRWELTLDAWHHEQAETYRNNAWLTSLVSNSSSCSWANQRLTPNCPAPGSAKALGSAICTPCGLGKPKLQQMQETSSACLGMQCTVKHGRAWRSMTTYVLCAVCVTRLTNILVDEQALCAKQ